MKHIEIPDYRSPLWLANGHLATIIPHLFRRVKPVEYKRERIETTDGDFLDLDWSASGHSRKLILFSHGLEGSSRAKYIQGMVPHFRNEGFDILAWNFRSCSGEINRTARFYHSGATDDLDRVVQHVLQTTQYEQIFLIGFSMGGNITLKYLGEKHSEVPERIKSAVVFSVPCDLQSASEKLNTGMGRVYTRKFLITLNKKLIQKKDLLRNMGIELNGLTKIWDFTTWDDRFTAPIHGFKSAQDYYTRSSSKPFLKDIRVPTLIVNAKNDPFLGKTCFPEEELKSHPFVRLSAPDLGGHVGFASRGAYWSESLALAALR